jgi:hypothetical protein
MTIDAVTEDIKAQTNWYRSHGGRGVQLQEGDIGSGRHGEMWDDFEKSGQKGHRGKQRNGSSQSQESPMSSQPVVSKETSAEVAPDAQEISPEEKARKEKLVAFITKGIVPDDDRVVKEFKRFIHSFQVTEKVGKKLVPRTHPAQTLSDLDKLFLKDKDLMGENGLSEADDKAAFAEYLADNFEEWRKDPDFHLRVRTDKIKELNQVGLNSLYTFVKEWPHATGLGIRVVKEGNGPNATDVLRNMAIIYPGGSLNLSVDWLPEYFENCGPHIKNEAGLIKIGHRDLSKEPVDGIKFYLVNGHFRFITPESTDEMINDILKHIEINGHKLPENTKITIIRPPKSADAVNN